MDWLYMSFSVLVIVYYSLKKKNYELTTIAYSLLILLIAILMGTTLRKEYSFIIIAFCCIVVLNIIALLRKSQSYLLSNFDYSNEHLVNGLNVLLNSLCPCSSEGSKIILDPDRFRGITFYNFTTENIKICLSKIDKYINLNKKKFSILDFIKTNIVPIIFTIVFIIHLISILF